MGIDYNKIFFRQGSHSDKIVHILKTCSTTLDEKALLSLLQHFVINMLKINIPFGNRYQ
jgi:hypothetical protein